MSHQNIRFVLWSIAITMLLVTGWMIDRQILRPRPQFSFATSANTLPVPIIPKPRSSTVESTNFSEQDFIFVWGKLLKRPLEDPAPATAKPKPVEITPERNAKSIPEISLVGTLIETNNEARRAWLVFPGGVRKLVSMGQALDGFPEVVTVQLIEDRRVVIKWGDVDLVKELPLDISKRFESL